MYFPDQYYKYGRCLRPCYTLIRLQALCLLAGIRSYH